MKRILIGGLLGGIIVFAWGAVSHMVLPIGTIGIKTLPNEAAVVGAMKNAIPEPGFYFFPGMDMSGKATPEEEKAWQARYAQGPTGILVYHPQGEQPLSPKLLGIELLSNILAALIAAILLARTSGSFVARVLCVALLGLFAWMSLSVSYWNWYGFPESFIAAEAIDQVVGWLFGGLALAAIVNPASR